MKTKLLVGTAIFAVGALAWPAMAETPAGPQSVQLAQMDKGGAPGGGATGGGAPSGGAPGAPGQGAAPEGSRKTDVPAAKSGEREQKKNGPAGKGAAEKDERSQGAKGEAKDETKRGDKDQGRDMKRGEKDKDKNNSADRREGKDKDSKASDRNRDDKNSSANKESGKSAGKNVQLDQAKQTRVKTVIRSQKVKRVSRSQINISISVGTRVPQRVRWYPVPVGIIEVVPEYRGYYYIIVDDDIIIIEPRTREIVAVIAL